MDTVCLPKDVAGGEPVRYQGCLSTTLIPCDDQRLILNLDLIQLLRLSPCC